MAVLMTVDLPVPREVMEAVTEEMDARRTPPDGLIAHVLTESGDGCRVVDIWESEQQAERFRTDRLMPAIGKVFADRGMERPDRPPQPSFTAAHDLVVARR